MSTPQTPAPGATPASGEPSQGGATPPPASTEPNPQGATPDPQLGPTGLEALRREREAREAAEKEANEVKARLKALEDKDKDEVTREREAREAAEKEAAETKRTLMRYEVAVETSLPANLAKFITGDDKAAMVTNANELKSNLGPRPASDFDQGHRTPPPGDAKPEDLHRQTVLELLRPGSTQTPAA